MDIKQLKNFVIIVESDFNLSETSKKIHISQPALSQMILHFEKEENIELFKRSNGRLQSLTPAGENFYYHAIELLKQYEEMMEGLRDASSKMKGRVKIGIPPLVNTVLFTEIIPKLIMENPNIQFDIIEMGAFELQKSLILQEIDLGVLLKPSDFKENNIQEVLIANDDLCAFMSKDHRLACKDKLSWSDLNNESMAIFTESFMINHYLMTKFESENIRPHIKIRSHSWDYLLHATEHSSLVTVLPSPISDFCSLKNLVKVEFDHPINWEVTLCRQVKAHYTRVESSVFRCLCDYFNNHNA
jgi:DNA-binding transcriptional LysR family regulator